MRGCLCWRRCRWARGLRPSRRRRSSWERRSSRAWCGQACTSALLFSAACHAKPCCLNSLTPFRGEGGALLDGGWMVRLTDVPLDLNDPTNIKALLRDCARFPQTGGHSL
ncbi:DUF5953 family protein [Melittangium boletus]|uniref:DUF5953 family protein n=1 Tax=Melittangium boletus TaxID=83453 RepID=UPI003183736C